MTLRCHFTYAAAAAILCYGTGTTPVFAETVFAETVFAETVFAETAATNDMGDSTPVIEDAELATLRGGFAIGGLNIALGADIKTFINDQLALHTVVTWNDHAASQTQVLSGALTMVQAGNLRDQVLASGNIRMQIGSSPVFTANDGQTAITHRTDGTLQNILINTASNVNVRQEIDATLDVGGYTEFANNLQNIHMSNAFGSAINDAVVSFGR